MKQLTLLCFTILSIAGCSKHSNQESAASFPPDKFYFKGTIDGSPVNWSSANLPGFSTSTMERQTGILSNDCNGNFCRELGFSSYMNFTAPVAGESKNLFDIDFIYASKNEDFTPINSWLDAGARNFGSFRNSISEPVNDGVILSYVDANGQSWDSDLRFGNQDGSSFTSIGLKDAAPDKPYEKIWTARFSCKLYFKQGCPPDPVTYTTMNVSDAEICLPVFQRKQK